jgi:hypothetical protein
MVHPKDSNLKRLRVSRKAAGGSRVQVPYGPPK